MGLGIPTPTNVDPPSEVVVGFSAATEGSVVTREV